jgi:predicted O-methyltransferase YrrM
VNATLTSVYKYARHLMSASNGKGHGTHSPFIFHLIRDIFNDRHRYPEYDAAENLRKKMLAEDTRVLVTDLGAGSQTFRGKEREVSSIARHSAKPAKLGQLLFRLARATGGHCIVELGTSLGITTSYLALGSKQSRVFTLEGAESLARIAEANFNDLGLENVELIQGNFDETFPPLVERLSSIDLLFVDGNHRTDPTLAYFHKALPAMQNAGMMIFDDIHWSGEMEMAWKHIQEHEKVTCTVDLFWMGLVFFRREFHEKQHFRIRF